MQIISRSEAKRLGLKRYFTGNPCCHGHVCERHVSSFGCIGCIDREKMRQRASQWFRDNTQRHKEYAKLDHVKNKERNNKRSRDWSQANKERHRENGRSWRAKNQEKAKTASLMWRTKNPDKHREIRRSWTQRNPDKVQNFVRMRRARKAAAEGSFSHEAIKEINRLQNGRCAYCRISMKGKYQVDHIVPISRGGTNFPNNLQLVCSKYANGCNQRKGNKDPIEYAQSLGLLL